MAKRNIFKWYTKVLKSGKVRRYARDVRGRYKKYEDADTLDRPEGDYRIIEYIFYFKYMGRGAKPSDHRNWEVRIKTPEGDYDIDNITDTAKEILGKLCNDELVDASDVTSKIGREKVEYSKDDDTKWLVMDATRPQFKYPKSKSWGIYGEDEGEE